MTEVLLRRGEYPTLTYVTIGSVMLAFSYETIVAFRAPASGWVVSENVWSGTTGKHLNAVAGNKHPRTPRAEFEERLEGLLGLLGAVA